MQRMKQDRRLFLRSEQESTAPNQLHRDKIAAREQYGKQSDMHQLALGNIPQIIRQRQDCWR
jgi:hypothetical protein